jgi:hypothetical protein
MQPCAIGGDLITVIFPVDKKLSGFVWRDGSFTNPMSYCHYPYYGQQY